MIFTVSRYWLGGYFPLIPHITAAIIVRISIDNFLVATRLVNANAVIFTGNWSEVGNHHNFMVVGISAYKGEYGVLVVINHQPFETLWGVVELVQWGMLLITMI